MGTMRETIRAEFAKSMVTYEDMPRETWLFDYPAQVFKILESYHNLSRFPWQELRLPGPMR